MGLVFTKSLFFIIIPSGEVRKACALCYMEYKREIKKRPKSCFYKHHKTKISGFLRNNHNYTAERFKLLSTSTAQLRACESSCKARAQRVIFLILLQRRTALSCHLCQRFHSAQETTLSFSFEGCSARNGLQCGFS